MANDVKTISQVRDEKYAKKMAAVARWTSFYRANPHRFARDYLGIQLFWFQEILLVAMFAYSKFLYLASRGQGKSWLLALFCCCYSILYPGSVICIASGKRGQAQEVIDKIKEYFYPRSANLQREISEIKTTSNDSSVTFKNGSKVKIVTSAESARHNRATVLIVDEFVKVPKDIIDSVLRRFLTVERMPGFLSLPQYKGRSDIKEPNKELYASSCWYESHWSYDKVKSYCSNMLQGRSYFACSLPYQLAIREGLLSRLQVEDEMSENDFNEIAFYMEMEALFFGQTGKSFFSFDDISKCRKLKYPCYPRDLSSLITDKRVQVPPKEPGEIRILSADIALIASTRNKNDATSLFFNRLIPNTHGDYVSNICYTENNEGLRTDDQAVRIRQLYEDFACDYIVLDARGLGIGVYDALVKDLYDEDRGVTYPALTCCNDRDYASRCVVPDAKPAIWVVLANSDFNSTCALLLRDEFKRGRIRLPQTDYDCEDVLSSLKGFSTLTPQNRARAKMPYVHTTLLVNELVNLDCEVKNGIIKLKEKSGERKDRYSSLSYNVYVARELAKKHGTANRRQLRDEETGELCLVFSAPKIL